MNFEDCKVGMLVRYIGGRFRANIVEIGKTKLVHMKYGDGLQVWANPKDLDQVPIQSEIVEATYDAFAKAQ